MYSNHQNHLDRWLLVTMLLLILALPACGEPGGVWVGLTPTPTPAPPFITFGVNKAEASPGSTLRYTLLVHNPSTTDYNNVLARVALDPGVIYEPESGFLIRTGRRFPLPDDWYTTGLNMGKVTAGSENVVIFTARVPQEWTAGPVITTTGQVEFENIDLQAYSVTTALILDDERTILQSANNTFRATVATDDLLVIRILINNIGDYPARNTDLHLQLPLEPSMASLNIAGDATLNADNSDPVNVSAQLYAGNSPVYLTPRDSTATLIGNTDLYNCPQGCDIPLSFLQVPMILGKVPPKATVEIEFKAELKFIEQ